MSFNRRRFAIVSGSVITPLVLLGAGYLAGLRWARTPSLPEGIYRVTTKATDPLIEFCPTGETSRESVERGYRYPALTCPDRHAPLMKPIVARPGDTVKTTPNGVEVNGHMLRNSKPFPYDGQHRPMHIWPFGSYVVQPHTFWVVSEYNKASYDSRYYGPVTTGDVVHYAHPVWQFAH